MTVVTDFYQFKYSRSSYYIDLFINRSAILTIEDALDERLSDLSMTKDTECAYMRLKELFQASRLSNDSMYVEVSINKCYLKYIKNLYYYFISRDEYMPLRVLNEYLQMFFVQDLECISQFCDLNEEIKVRVLSNV